MNRSRAADDYETIRQRMEELRREREGLAAGPGERGRQARQRPRIRCGKTPPPADGRLAAALGPDDLRQAAAALASGITASAPAGAAVVVGPVTLRSPAVVGLRCDQERLGSKKHDRGKNRREDAGYDDGDV